MGKVSMNDIALALGVSKTLVSMVLNGKGDAHGISKETQKKVKEKVKELNYIPNPVARGLRTGKSNLIGLIVPDISNYFFSRLAWQIERMVAEQGYNLMIASSDEDFEKEKTLINVYKGQMVDALIIAPCGSSKKDYQILEDVNLPFVFLDRKISRYKTDYVGLDNVNGAYSAVKRLINSKKESIQMLSITPAHLSNIKERIKGFSDALKDHNQNKANGNNVIEISYQNIEKEVNDYVKNVVSKSKVDAVLTANNTLAKCFLDACKNQGVSIPDQVALISFDDVDLFKYSNPAISCVSQPIEEMGQKTVEIIFDILNNKDSKRKSRQYKLDSELTLRNSI